ncbi:DUF3100 domain-containing protein [Agrobacterium sp. NPDC089420]|uniref:DUF3100 domain-containing protein n=1 Tax=Agrobacterium sp. NPDC089420 TaxID=3363918 RepID=UPI00384B8985
MTSIQEQARPSPVFLGWRAHVCVAVIALIAQSIGTTTLQAFGLKMSILPMVWALCLALMLTLIASRGVAEFALDRPAKALSPAFGQIVLLGFITKLGLMIGPQLPAIKSMGWALAFQEFGHFFGTIVFALPLALFLGIKREAIGATFSVGREPNIAIIADRYGLDSPEGRGIIGEYLTGSTIGAPFMALFASIIVSLGFFDPIALAMGAGVGSASMLAAITASINSGLDKATADKVMAVAAAANLITTVLGTYFTLFISLPVAIWLYGKLEPIIGRNIEGVSNPVASGDAPVFTFNHNPFISFSGKVVALIISGAMILLIGNWLGYGVQPEVAIAGFLVIAGITLIADRAVAVLPFKLPAICIASLIGMVATAPFHPYSAQIAAWTAQIHPLAFATPALAYVGLAVADELGALKRLSWRIVVVSLTAAVGSFLGATLIAHLFEH